MQINATYASKAGGRTIGRDVEYTEKRHPILRSLGVSDKKRVNIEFEGIEFLTAQEILNRLLAEDGFFMLELADKRSSVDFADCGDHEKFFIEQYFDRIYGGIYDTAAAMQIVQAIFEGCSSEELRDLFLGLPGVRVYEY
jgi:hypothetical protein